MKYPKVCRNCINFDENTESEGDCTLNPVWETVDVLHYCGQFEYNLLIQKETMSSAVGGCEEINIDKFIINTIDSRGWYICDGHKYLDEDGRFYHGIHNQITSFWKTEEKAVDFLMKWLNNEYNK